MEESLGAVIPAKVKHFIRCAFHNFLPTMCNLWHRKLGVSPFCLVCAIMGESIEHVLFICSRAQSVWRGILPRWKSFNFNSLNNKSWVDWFSQLSKEECTLACVNAWSIWGGSK